MQYLKDKVRERIYDAAVTEFKTYGYQDASIRNIAAQGKHAVLQAVFAVSRRCDRPQDRNAHERRIQPF